MRRTGLLPISALLVVSPLLVGQNAAKQPSPALPAEVLGPQLIAWSELQKPRPVPQPLPPPDRADQEQPNQQPEQPTDSSAQPQPSTQTFTGTIVRNSGKYILKASESVAYEVDDQEKAKPYEGEQVKIVGSLTNSILHVVTIELLS